MSVSVTTPGLVARSKTVASVADEYADWGDKEGRLTEPVLDALHREGLFGMWVPLSISGGAELDPVSSLQLLENVSYSDPSVGWVLMAAALAIGTGAAYLDDSAVSELFGGNRLPSQASHPANAGFFW